MIFAEKKKLIHNISIKVIRAGLFVKIPCTGGVFGNMNLLVSKDP